MASLVDDNANGQIVNKALLSIDYSSTYIPIAPYFFMDKSESTLAPENQEMSDYLQEGDAGFKKPKVSSSLVLQLAASCLIPPNRRRRSVQLDDSQTLILMHLAFH